MTQTLTKSTSTLCRPLQETNNGILPWKVKKHQLAVTRNDALQPREHSDNYIGYG